MTDKRMLDFPQDVSDVLNIDCAELRSIYRDWRTEICNDAISALPLGKWRYDGLSLTPLATRTNNEIVSLQDWYREEGEQHKPKIILILESPHKDEYVTRCDECSKGFKCGLYASPAPARGATGRNIKQLLPMLFKNNFEDCHVAFMNIIQYQCSLGMPLYGYPDNQKRKNKIVKELFLDHRENYGYFNEFISRLDSIYEPENDVVVICTTGGVKVRDRILKEVKTALDTENVAMQYVLSANHPSYWNPDPYRHELLIKMRSEAGAMIHSTTEFTLGNADMLHDALFG